MVFPLQMTARGYFVVNEESDTLSVIDTHKSRDNQDYPVGDNPQYVALNPDETLAYVTNMNSNTDIDSGCTRY